jgi:hypothetical protein
MEAMKPVKVYSANNKVEAGMLMNLLEGNGIQSFKQGPGSGGYMEIKYGFSIYGQDIYVDENDAERARELIMEVLTPVEEETEEEASNTEEDEEEEEPAAIAYKQRHTRQQILFIRILVILLGLDLLLGLIIKNI